MWSLVSGNFWHSISMSICYYYDIWLRILPKRSGIWRISGANRGIGSHEFCFLTSIGLLHNLAEYIFIFSLSADRQWGFSSFITPLERVQYQTGWDHLWLASRRRYNLDQFNWWKTPDYLDQCFSSQSSSYIHSIYSYFVFIFTCKWPSSGVRSNGFGTTPVFVSE